MRPTNKISRYKKHIVIALTVVKYIEELKTLTDALPEVNPYVMSNIAKWAGDLTKLDLYVEIVLPKIIRNEHEGIELKKCIDITVEILTTVTPIVYTLYYYYKLNK